MKISVKDLHKPLHIEIKGDEDWLGPVYQSFAIDSRESFAPGVDRQPRTLRGNLNISINSYGYVVVDGRLNYAPLVSCSRCDLIVTYDVGQDVASVYKPSSTAASRDERDVEVTLSADDLDERLIEDGKIDIESLINDLVQTAIPLQTCQTDDRGMCHFCGVDVSAAKVFSSVKEGENDPTSPFAKLAGIKVPK